MTPHHPASAALERVEQAAEQAGDVTKALLTFSHKQPEERQPVDITTLVAKSIRLFHRILPASIDIVPVLDPAPAVWVNADKVQLQQVLLNLVINAKDAMPDGGRWAFPCHYRQLSAKITRLTERRKILLLVFR